MTDAATDQTNGIIVEDDCPLCLEPLPPFWDTGRRISLNCCGKFICSSCNDQRKAYLERAVDSGSFGMEEVQLAFTCPLCRTRSTIGCVVAAMLDRFEKGQLPLDTYYILGVNFVDGEEGVEINVEKGLEILMLGAEKGDPMCQYWIGSWYEEGIDGLPKSTAEAKRWYLAATEQGHAIAEYNLANMLRDEGNDAEYLRHLRDSASKGCNEGCYALGLAYVHGDYGLQQSTEEAIRVLIPAAERRHAKSMGLLGFAMIKHGSPSPNKPNFTKGMHWLRQAAEKGNEDAISNLKEVEEYASTECFGCNKQAPAKSFLRCSRCRAAWYCSKDCQRWHWKATEGGHKQCCIKWK